MDKSSERFEPAWLGREDPLILHYTSGSTGKWVPDLKSTDTYWCTADPGWVTGTSYGIFALWLNGTTNVIRGGRFDAGAWYATIEKHRVTVWYSAPTAFRMLMAAGEKVAEKYDLSDTLPKARSGEIVRRVLKAWDQGLPVGDISTREG